MQALYKDLPLLSTICDELCSLSIVAENDSGVSSGSDIQHLTSLEAKERMDDSTN